MKESPLEGNSPKLRYIPGDLAPGAVLAERDGDKVGEPTLIDAALSLYFNWENHRKAHVSFSSDRIARPCVVSFDEDEAIASELRISLCDTSNVQHQTVGSELLIQLEIFNVSYAFTALITAFDPDAKYGFHFVISIPTEMIVQKRRPVPRVRINSEQSTEVLRPRWKSLSSESFHKVSISEIDVNTVYLDDTSLPQEDGLIELDGKLFHAELSHKGSRGTVITLRFETPIDSGAFFDIYKRFAFPSLESRPTLPTEKIFDAYKESGFFDKFLGSAPPEVVAQYRESLQATWKSLESGAHKTVADYCSVSSEGTVIGASSLALAFKTPERDVWAIQQLCVRSEPEFFQNTRELYLWRPVYLTGRPDTFDVVCWFDSKSRWIERIWIKFVNHKGNLENTLWPVTMRVFKPIARAQSETDIKAYKIGENVRKYIAAPRLLAATDPSSLNFAKLLNHVSSIPPSASSAEELKRHAEVLASVSENPESEYRLSVPHNIQDPELSQLPIHNLDRLCYFEKQDLPFLYTSIEHSIAVMERKHRERT